MERQTRVLDGSALVRRVSSQELPVADFLLARTPCTPLDEATRDQSGEGGLDLVEGGERLRAAGSLLELAGCLWPAEHEDREEGELGAVEGERVVVRCFSIKQPSTRISTASASTCPTVAGTLAG